MGKSTALQLVTERIREVVGPVAISQFQNGYAHETATGRPHNKIENK